MGRGCCLFVSEMIDVMAENGVISKEIEDFTERVSKIFDEY